MESSLIIERLADVGVSMTLEDGELVARPGSKVPTELDSVIGENKPALVEYLSQQKKAKRLEYRRPGNPLEYEAQALEKEVLDKGFVLTWCELLSERVAFIASVGDRVRVPEGVIGFTIAELKHIEMLPPESFKLLYQAKKAGAIITDSKPDAEMS